MVEGNRGPDVGIVYRDKKKNVRRYRVKRGENNFEVFLKHFFDDHNAGGVKTSMSFKKKIERRTTLGGPRHPKYWRKVYRVTG